MKTVIVYTSIAHGNTEKVARAMAGVLQADLVKTGEAVLEAIDGYDLIGFGSGVYNGRHHRDIFDLVDRLSASSGKKVFVFSTSGYGTTRPHGKLVKELENKGFQVVGTFACKGFDTAGINRLYGGAAKGRPNDDDLQQAKAFAQNLLT
jgi:flavodoxin